MMFPIFSVFRPKAGVSKRESPELRLLRRQKFEACACVCSSTSDDSVRLLYCGPLFCIVLLLLAAWPLSGKKNSTTVVSAGQ